MEVCCRGEYHRICWSKTFSVTE